MERKKVEERKDIRATGGSGEKGLQHGKVGKVELVDDDIWGVDAGSGEGGAHGGAGEYVVHCGGFGLLLLL